MEYKNILGDLKPGDKIVGRKHKYVINHLVRTGGYGSIYYARSSNGMEVIVKKPILNHPDGLGRVRLQRLRNEAKILNSNKLIRHKNIVSYVDESKDENEFFLVLEYVKGCRVKDYVNRPLNKEEAVNFVEKLLEVLAFLHRNGILHRDVNTKNILLRKNENGRNQLEDFVLIDFGIAKENWSKDTAKENNPIGGTKGWSAPEQFSSPSKSYPSSDIYSVGCLLFYLLTKLNPYPKYINESGLKIGPEAKKFIDDKILNIIKVAVDPDPMNRYQTAEEMLYALKGIVPYVEFSGDKYRLGGITEIGRAHICGQTCRMRGFFKPLDLSIKDEEKRHISLHHARIYIRPNGKAFIVDLGSLNKTALRHQGEKKFQILTPNKSYELTDGDEIALVYNEKLGPYKILNFKRLSET